MANVQFISVYKSYGAKTVLHDISLNVEDSEFMVLVGPSGCGKSTLLRSTAGFEQVDAGTILISGERVNELPPGRRRVAMVFQSYALYPHMTVADNIGFCLRNIGMPRADRAKRILETAKLLQIEGLLSRRPHQLSGGQRQRVAIGRAIVRSPALYLFDEPLSSLDPQLRAQTRIEILRLHQRLKTTTIYVTHDQLEAMTLADRIAVMNAGRIEQIGSPLELYHHPANMFVAAFLGSPQMNFINGTLISYSSAAALVRIAGGAIVKVRAGAFALYPGDPLTVGIRPEHLRLSHNQDDLAIEVTAIERLGSRTLVYGRLLGTDDYTPILFEHTEGARHAGPGPEQTRVGEVLNLQIPEERGHLFGVRGEALPRDALDYARTA